MALITDLEIQPPVGGTQTAKRIPSYMQPTKTSTRKAGTIEEGLGASVLKQRDGNPLQRVPLKPILKVKGSRVKATLKNEGKENKVITSGIPVLKKSTLIKPTNKTSDGSGALVSQKSTTKRPRETTLGKLFTDGGLEDILIKVLEMMVPKDMAKCLNVCKNTNEVMVKTSSIQVWLLVHLYGFRHSRIFTGTEDSLQTIRSLRAIYRHSTLSFAARLRGLPLSLPNADLYDVQGQVVLVREGYQRWALLLNGILAPPTPLAFVDGARLTLCAEDQVVIDLHTRYVLKDEYLVARFYTMRTSGPTPQTTHPEAKFGELTLRIRPHFYLSTSSNCKLRLYPGGLAAVLRDNHRCASHSGCESPTYTSISIVVFNWQLGSGLGVVKLPYTTVQVLDFRFLSATQIVCSSLRIQGANSRPFPCIDVYDVSQSPAVTATAIIEPEQLPAIPLRASFRFPELANKHPSCIGRSAPQIFSAIDKFDLKVGQHSGTATMFDQVMTFRIGGRAKSKSEAIEGVISISGLHSIMLEEEKETTDGRTPVQVDWERWCSAVSLQQSTSISVLEPKHSQTAKVARSRNDPSQVLLVVRDYNQAMLYVPPGREKRRLGCLVEDLKINDGFNEVEVSTSYEVVTQSKTLTSDLFFCRVVNYGLGHRKRTIELANCSYNTALATVSWSDAAVWISFTTRTQTMYHDPRYHHLFYPLLIPVE